MRRRARGLLAGLLGINLLFLIGVLVALGLLVGLLGAATVVISAAEKARCSVAEAMQVAEPSAETRGGIPANYLALYQQYGEQYGVPWAVLAGIGKIETDHGRSTEPGVREGFNRNGCCAGPMQFNLHNGPPSTWESYRVDGDGDGNYDVYDPRDAIPSAANYIKTLVQRAHGVMAAALLGYNNSGVYVTEVTAWAGVYTGLRGLELAAPIAFASAGDGTDGRCAQAAGLDAAAGPVELQTAVRLTEPRAYRMLPRWAMAGTRAPQPVDARLYDDMVWLLRQYHLQVTSARTPGHKTHGDGTALDLIPADGSTQAVWDASAGAAARDLGWTRACSGSGSRGPCPLIPALHWIGYDGYLGHGSPRTCRAYWGCYAHLHVSWESPCYGTGRPSPPCSSVMAFPAPVSTEPATAT
jgi:hypothetical protein